MSRLHDAYASGPLTSASIASGELNGLEAPLVGLRDASQLHAVKSVLAKITVQIPSLSNYKCLPKHFADLKSDTWFRLQDSALGEPH